MSPEGQARLATSSCYWAMPVNTKAALTDEQKKILRWADQPGYPANFAALSRAVAELDAKMQEVWTEMLQKSAAQSDRPTGPCHGAGHRSPS